MAFDKVVIPFDFPCRENDNLKQPIKKSSLLIEVVIGGPLPGKILNIMPLLPTA